MVKEIKYFIFTLLILLFLFLTGRYYFSDTNKKNSYRSLSSNNQKIETYSKNLPIFSKITFSQREFIQGWELFLHLTSLRGIYFINKNHNNS